MMRPSNSQYVAQQGNGGRNVTPISGMAFLLPEFLSLQTYTQNAVFL